MEKNYSPVDARVDFIRQEHEILKWWEDQRIFEQLRARNSGGPVWSFIDGPITANNPMGVHHAWGRTLKDIFQRYRAMRGYDQRYQNGFDCQGLWVEVEVERELGFTSKKDIETYGVEAFVERCKERVRKYAAVQTEQSRRLGYWMDWDNSYYTMSDENNYTIWGFLKKVHEKGWLRRGEDAMPWCPRCGTGISQHEMTEGYREIEDKAVYVLLPLVDRENEFLVIWTTTPWTLPANVAAAVGPKLEYQAIKDGERTIYMVAEAVPRIFGRKYRPEVAGTVLGAEMVGWIYRGPFDDLPPADGLEHRVIPWSEVSTEEGSGIVHIAPGCGKEDFDLGLEYELRVIAPLNDDGIYLDGFDWLTGKSALDVSAGILADLKQKALILKQELYTHRYPHCWRCKTKLVFRVVTEWYIRMDELRHEIMAVARQINWLPPFGLDRELDWLTNMSDWMISKKRYWGLALPIYECGQCETVTIIGSREELEQKAVSGWEQFDGHSPHRPWIDRVQVACDGCGEPAQRIKDVGTPWLDAGIVPFSTLRYTSDRAYWDKWFPADFITESFPGQFRNWFYSMLAMSTVLENRPPFKTVLGHALVKDTAGKDMHKSDGNAILFDDAAEQMGVDAMRWMYADQNPEQNLRFGFDRADDVRKQLLTLWNSYSFFVTYAALDHFNPQAAAIELAQRPEIDRWLAARTEQLVQTARTAYDSYQPDRVMQAVETYLELLSNWYIRRNRRRFWKSANDTDKLAAYSTLHEALVTLVQVLAPVTPFLSEAIYKNLVTTLDSDAPASVHLCPFPEYRAERVDAALLEEIDLLIQVVTLGRAARNRAGIKIRQPLQTVIICGPERVTAAIGKNRQQLLEELNIKELQIRASADALIQYELRPNLPLLGPRLGKQMGAVTAALAELPIAESVAALRKNGPLTVRVGAEQVVLAPGEVLLNEEGVAPYAVATWKDVVLAVDTSMTDELQQEGAVRDLIRQVQNMRKEAQLNVDDRIVVGIAADERISRSLSNFEEYFLAEVLGTQLSSSLEHPDHQKVVNLNGADVQIHIARA